MSETNTDNRRMMDAARAASTGKSSLTGYARLVFFMLRKMRGPVLQVQLPDGAVHEFAGDDKSTPPIVLSTTWSPNTFGNTYGGPTNSG
ncbi:MAG: hypothetical protein EBT71_07670, partial [Alphaproteobacteria bacterium]|nr:hypothetical protein [Alphaproteobacteria bacterium]